MELHHFLLSYSISEGEYESSEPQKELIEFLIDKGAENLVGEIKSAIHFTSTHNIFYWQEAFYEWKDDFYFVIAEVKTRDLSASDEMVKNKQDQVFATSFKALVKHIEESKKQ